MWKEWKLYQVRNMFVRNKRKSLGREGRKGREGCNERKLQKERDGENPLGKRGEKAGWDGMRGSYRKKGMEKTP